MIFLPAYFYGYLFLVLFYIISFPYGFHFVAMSAFLSGACHIVLVHFNRSSFLTIRRAANAPPVQRVRHQGQADPQRPDAPVEHAEIQEPAQAPVAAPRQGERQDAEELQALDPIEDSGRGDVSAPAMVDSDSAAGSVAPVSDDGASREVDAGSQGFAAETLGAGDLPSFPPSELLAMDG
jgi:hypothetical protein